MSSDSNPQHPDSFSFLDVRSGSSVVNRVAVGRLSMSPFNQQIRPCLRACSVLLSVPVAAALVLSL